MLGLHIYLPRSPQISPYPRSPQISPHLPISPRITQVFQLSKCSACHTPLDLPSVHFLCMHSFHRGCLADADAECPVCAPQRRRIRAAAATSAAREAKADEAASHARTFEEAVNALVI